MDAEPTIPKRQRGQRVWTDAQRAEQAAKCRTRKIWMNSTGPRTTKGKSISCLNALKHGQYSRPVLSFMKHFKTYRAYLRSLWAQRSQMSHFQRNELREPKENKYFGTTRITRRLPKHSKQTPQKLQLAGQNLPRAVFIFAQMN